MRTQRIADTKQKINPRRIENAAKTRRGKKLLAAKDLEDEELGKIQENKKTVIVGADVEALYPSLIDIEVAIICYNAIVESNIEFQNICYRTMGNGYVHFVHRLAPHQG